MISNRAVEFFFFFGGGRFANYHGEGILAPRGRPHGVTSTDKHHARRVLHEVLMSSDEAR